LPRSSIFPLLVVLTTYRARVGHLVVAAADAADLDRAPGRMRFEAPLQHPAGIDRPVRDAAEAGARRRIGVLQAQGMAPAAGEQRQPAAALVEQEFGRFR